MHAAAQHLQAQGRGDDSMLVHMTPGEVGGLHALARATGGSLTINPQTGLVEAGWLSSLLPMVLGAVLTPLTGGLINPFTASLLVGAGTGLVTRDLGKGLMAGLSAYGGAGLASGLATAIGGAGATTANAFGLAGTFGNAAGAAPGSLASAMGAGGTGLFAPVAATGSTGLTSTALAGNLMPKAVTSAPLPNIAGSTIAPGSALASQAPAAAAPASGGFMSSFFGPSAEAGKGILGTNITGGQAAMGLGIGLPLLSAMEPKQKDMPEEVDKYPYKGPYKPAPRKVRFPTDRDPNDSSEFQYFDVVNPVPGVKPYDPKEDKPIETLPYPSMAAGGVSLKDGSFVVDARTVSELGNGSSGAGQDLLARFGGKSIKGPGDGVSDSIRANIGGRQEARVARDEVKFDPKAVQRLGKGNPKKGSDRLYALMAKAHDARQSAKRGQDTGLKGLLGAR